MFHCFLSRWLVPLVAGVAAGLASAGELHGAGADSRSILAAGTGVFVLIGGLTWFAWRNVTRPQS